MAKYIEGDHNAKGLRFGIVVSRFNDFVTSKLLSGPIMVSRNGKICLFPYPLNTRVGIGSITDNIPQANQFVVTYGFYLFLELIQGFEVAVQI